MPNKTHDEAFYNKIHIHSTKQKFQDDDLGTGKKLSSILTSNPLHWWALAPNSIQLYTVLHAPGMTREEERAT